MYISEYTFVEKNYRTITKSDAKDLGAKNLNLKLKEAGATDIKAEITSIKENADEYIFEYDIVCLMDIGVNSPIQIE